VLEAHPIDALMKRRNQLDELDRRRLGERQWVCEQDTQESPFKDALNNAPKYVASRTLREPLPWPNSTLLDEDAADAVAKLKKEPGNDLHVMGSGELIQALMQRNLIDEYMLLIHPLVLGSGRQLFPEGSAPASLRVVDSATTTTTGVVIATYRPAS
jgi:dihydrofolate reductase